MNTTIFQSMLNNFESLNQNFKVDINEVTFFKLIPSTDVMSIGPTSTNMSQQQLMRLMKMKALGISKKREKYLRDFSEYSPTKYLYIQTNFHGSEDCIVHLFFHLLKGSQYAYNILIENDKHPEIVRYRQMFSFQNFCDDIAIDSLGHLLLTLNEKDSVMSKSRPSLKTRSGQDIIVPIVYVSDKKTINKFQALESTPIEWTHSWEVIGHWRTIKGLGKDQQGNRTVEGKTWVSACVKGDGELIKKVRVLG